MCVAFHFLCYYPTQYPSKVFIGNSSNKVGVNAAEGMKKQRNGRFCLVTLCRLDQNRQPKQHKSKLSVENNKGK